MAKTKKSDKISKARHDADAYFDRGNGLAKIGEYEGAFEAYRNAIRIDPDYAHAYHNIAAYLWKQGRYKASQEEAERAVSAYSRAKEKKKLFYARSDFLHLGSLHHRILMDSPQAKAVWEEGLGVNWNETAWLERLGSDPDDVRIMTSLVDLYLEEKDEMIGEERTVVYCHARELYKKAQLLLENQLSQEETAGIFHQLGQLQLIMKEYDESESNLRKAIEKDKDLPAPYADLGVLYMRKEDYKKAKECLEKALQRDPDSFVIQSNLAGAYSLLKARFLEKSETEYKRILAITSQHVESHIGLGKVYTDMGDLGDTDMYDQAICHFCTAIKVSLSGQGSKTLKKKEQADILYMKGYARVKLYESTKIRRDENLLDQALEDFNKSFCKDRDHHKARRAKEKLEKILDFSSGNRLLEKIEPWLISGSSFFIFVSTQVILYLGQPIRLDAVGYSLLIFGSLLFMVAGLYLPHIQKLKVWGIELEKGSVDQIRPTGTLGIVKESIQHGKSHSTAQRN
ncbi:tetratricopeptide repeat protein [Candidatus Acetothermia bacterium]|nr:tetratricopeptide repeat protein [Candidatus Acetothermia bacterium]